MRKDKDSKSTLGSLLTASSQAECADPWDKVDSLMGLVNDGTVVGKIIPDYKVSPFCVFAATVRVMVNRLERRFKGWSEDAKKIRKYVYI